MDISCLFYKLLDGPVELVDGLPVMVLHRLHNTVLQVVFQDHLAGIVQGAAHSSQLDEQSRPSSTMAFTRSRWPIARARRLTTARVCWWLWTCP